VATFIHKLEVSICGIGANQWRSSIQAMLCRSNLLLPHNLHLHCSY